MINARVVTTIEQAGKAAWNTVFADEVENYDYLRAVERAGLPEFRWRYYLIEEDGRLLAAAPGFLLDYPLETTLDSTGHAIVGMARRVWPRALKLRLSCLGSPCTETAQLGIANDVRGERRKLIVKALLRAFENEAHRESSPLLAVKDIPTTQNELWEPALTKYYARPGQPTAFLDIDFGTLDDYLARLSRATRKDVRRKLRNATDVRIERRDHIDDLLDDVMELYNETRSRADMRFEDLTPEYFRAVLADAGGHCVLYFISDALVAANIVLERNGILLDKFFCMKACVGRLYNLYFLSWITNVRYCLDRGIKRYQTGQAGYATKLRLASKLSPTTISFKHQNWLTNAVLRTGAALLSADMTEGAVS